MKQTSHITLDMAAAQEAHAAAHRPRPFPTPTRISLIAKVREALRAGAPLDTQTLQTVTEARIYTEQRDNLAGIVARFFQGATLSPAAGLWKGAIEHATVIVLLVAPAEFARVLELASAIRAENGQESVMVTWQPNVRLMSVTRAAFADSESAA